MPAPSRILTRLATPEIISFLAVGGVGYVVDVAAFNYLRSVPMLIGLDPSVAKTLAVGLAMIVTYVGNRAVTWRGESARGRHREVALFILFNIIGLGFSVLTLATSHDLLGLTSRLSDNISANVIGLALGTAFRYWSYKRFVFGATRERRGGGEIGGRTVDAWR
jgi:putative flippase GtrA